LQGAARNGPALSAVRPPATFRDCVSFPRSQYNRQLILLPGGVLSPGVLLSVMASVLFGGLYYFSTLLAPLSGEQIFGWRMLLTFPFVTLFMLCSSYWTLVREQMARMRRRPSLILLQVVTSALAGVQLWIFLWAPVNGRALEVSPGYFLLPLSMVPAGSLGFRAPPSRLPRLASGGAAAGRPLGTGRGAVVDLPLGAGQWPCPGSIAGLFPAAAEYGAGGLSGVPGAPIAAAAPGDRLCGDRRRQCPAAGRHLCLGNLAGGGGLPVLLHTAAAGGHGHSGRRPVRPAADAAGHRLVCVGGRGGAGEAPGAPERG